MGWFRREPRASSVPEVREQSTLALPEVLGWLESLRRPSILDFGPAVTANFARFSSYGGQLEILDLYAQLAEGASGARSAIPEDDIATLVRTRLAKSGVKAARDGGGFDLIVTWDYLDYLTAKQIAALFGALAPYRRTGTRIFAIISYVGLLPLVPRRLKIAAPGLLVWDAEAPKRRPSPRHNEPDVKRLLGSAKVISSHLMRHGVRELVLEDLTP